jgi:hypothetical protein
LIDAVKKYRRVKSFHRLVTLSPGATLIAMLSACSPQQNQPAVTAAAPSNFQSSEQCSMLGAMACNAMALLSSDSKPTCSAYRGGDGRRIETCGYADTGVRTAAPGDPQGYPVRLAWSDNSDNENYFVVERCDQIGVAPTNQKNAACAGVWRQIGTVGPNTTFYIDNTAAWNQTYVYRVKAANSKGSSGYSAEAVITTPRR